MFFFALLYLYRTYLFKRKRLNWQILLYTHSVKKAMTEEEEDYTFESIYSKSRLFETSSFPIFLFVFFLWFTGASLFINIVICPPYSSIWIDNGAFVLNKRYPKQKAQPRDTGNSRHNPEIQATEGKTQRYRQQKAQPRDTGNSMHNPEIQATVGTTQSYRQQ